MQGINFFENMILFGDVLVLYILGEIRLTINSKTIYL